MFGAQNCVTLKLTSFHAGDILLTVLGKQCDAALKSVVQKAVLGF